MKKTKIIFFWQVPSRWELRDCSYMPHRNSKSDSWWDLILCSALQVCPSQRKIKKESSWIQQDRSSPLHFLSLTESFSFTSLRKTRLRSSPTSWAICATSWPAGPITMLCRHKKDRNICFISQQEEESHLSDAGLKLETNLKGPCWKYYDGICCKQQGVWEGFMKSTLSWWTASSFKNDCHDVPSPCNYKLCDEISDYQNYPVIQKFDHRHIWAEITPKESHKDSNFFSIKIL